MNTKQTFMYGLIAVVLALSLTGCPDVNNLTKKELIGTVSFDNNSPKVGDTITATYAPGNGTGVQTWQWFRVDGTDVLIPGVTANAYTVTADDVGKKIKVQFSCADQIKSLSATTTNAVVATDITYIAVQAGGVDGTADTTAINFTFSGSVSDLTANDITVTNGTGSVTKGALSGSGTSWSLAVTVVTAGNVTVSINKSVIETGTRHVTVYKAGQAVPTLTGITAVYNGTTTIYPDTSFDTLKGGLTVTANYSDNSSETLDAADYTLSGTLTAGNRVITVTYQGKTATFTVTVNAPHNHNWGNWIQTTAPTCTEPGVETRNCTASPPHSETRTGAAALGHDAGAWHITLAATCEETGTRELRCTRDNAVLNTETVAALGHDWDFDNAVNTIDPTCTTKGSGTATCKREGCNETNTGTDNIPALGHDYQNWTQTTAPTCTTAGVETGTCIRDQVTTTRTGAVALGHDYQDWEETTAPTCTTAGVETGTCTRDQVTTTRAGAAALGHDYQNWQQTTAPTCTTAGIETGTCTRDQVTTTRTGTAALGHDWETTTTPATATTDGVEGQVCKNDPSHTQGTVLYATGTTGLEFVLIEDSWSSNNGTYSVRKGTVTTGTVHIPAYHRPNASSPYLPVTEVSSSDYSNGAFQGTTITAVTFASNSQLKIIGYTAFRNCTSLASITIPAGVTSIGNDAFNGCTSLTSITIPTGVTSIGSNAFNGCTSLTSITIPTGVMSISGNTFYGCTGLTSVNIPVGVMSIGDFTFYGCTGLTSVTIPNSVTSINMYAFAQCTSLTSITIPAGVTSIGQGAFNGCTNLTSANIPAGVISIGTDTFSYCGNLASITIPAGVTSIGDRAFARCYNIASITIPAGVTSIGSTAFESWRSNQTIYAEHHANQAAAVAAWGSDWLNYCYARIVYAPTAFTVTNTTEWNAAVTAIKNGGDNGNYVITVNGDVGVAGSTAATFGSVTNLSVTLKGSGKLYLTSRGSLIYLGTLNDPPLQTLIIDSPNLTLQGLTSGQNGATQNNNTSVVNVRGGTLELKNGTINGNYLTSVSYSAGGGVYVYNGTFIMSGGTISGNTVSDENNDHGYGGGVYVASGTFTMSGGTISGNTAIGFQAGNFGGRGGGVYMTGSSAAFTMYGGTISGNTARNGVGNNSTGYSRGGGVFMDSGTFRIVTGTIYGSDAGSSSNTVANSGFGMALYGSADRGTFNGTTWTSTGYYGPYNTDTTIRVLNGALE
jgi:hypothetical protein